MKRALSSPTDKTTLLRLSGIALMDDETLIDAVNIHGAIFWKGVAVAIIGLLMLLGFLQNVGILLLVVGLIMIALAAMTRRYLILAATDKRIFIRSGILYADMIEMRYAQIESIELGITPIGQIFGYGSVIITGTGQRRVIVPFVDEAISFRTKVNDILVNK